MNTVEPIRSKEDIARMKEALETDRDKLLFILGINSALRISDILKLKVGDVRNKTFITIKETKTTKSRTFDFSPSLLGAISKYVDDNAKDNDWLFPSRKGNKPITRVTAYRILNEAASKIGLTEKVGNIGTHSLRKTWGYHAYNSGVDLTLIQSVLNHASQRETLRYIGITQDQINDVFAVVSL